MAEDPAKLQLAEALDDRGEEVSEEQAEEWRARDKRLAELEAEQLPATAIDEVTDEQALEEAPGIELPVLTVPLSGMNTRVVVDKETGNKSLLIGPMLVNLVVPFGAEGAEAIGKQLVGGAATIDHPIRIAHGADEIAAAAAARARLE